MADLTIPLITPERAKQNAALSALFTANNPYFSSILKAASDLVRRYCNRDFTPYSYSEYHTVGPQPRGVPILLRQYPVNEITRVAFANQCLQIQNSGQTYQRATVETTATGMTIKTVASGVAATTVFPYTSYATISALTTAITALGNGWTVSTYSGWNGSYALYPPTDFKPLQGAVSALNAGAYIEIYDDVQPGSLGSGGAAGWNGSEDWSYGGTAWRLDPDTGELFMRSRRGSLALRIDYNAGYPVMPGAVEEAVVAVAQGLYQNSQVNQAIKSVKLRNSSEEYRDTIGIPQMAMSLLAPFRDVSRSINR